MEMSTMVSFGWIAGVLGILFGVYHWKKANDDKVDRDGQFKGIVNTKLDTIISDAKENARQHAEMEKVLNNHGIRISVLEESKKTPQRRKTTQDE